jgi:NAD(P)H-flavin reductase
MSKLTLIPNLEIIIKVSRPHKEHLIHQGRVTEELDRIPHNAEVYLCGNPDMVQSTEKYLEEIQEKKNISLYKESFTLSSHYTGKVDYHIFQ